MTHNDLLALLQDQEKEKANIAERLKEIKDLEDKEVIKDSIEYLLMTYFQEKSYFRVA